MDGYSIFWDEFQNKAYVRLDLPRKKKREEMSENIFNKRDEDYEEEIDALSEADLKKEILSLKSELDLLNKKYYNLREAAKQFLHAWVSGNIVNFIPYEEKLHKAVEEEK